MRLTAEKRPSPRVFGERGGWGGVIAGFAADIRALSWRIIALALPLGLSLLVGACGGGDSSGSGGDLSSTSASARPDRGIAGSAGCAPKDSARDDAVTCTPTLAATPSTSALLLGIENVQPSIDTNPSGRAEAFIYVAQATGTAAWLNVYLDASSTATRVVAGLYADANGSPGALLSSTAMDAPAAGAWNAFRLTNPVNVTAGTRYWIAVLTPPRSGTIAFRDLADGGGATVTTRQSNLQALPTAWVVGSRYRNSPLSANLSAEPVTPPIPTDPPTPPVTGWPNAANTGVRVATTRTLAGAVIDDAAWFSSHGFPGSGTRADPFVVDRVLFTDVVILGNWDSSNLTGRWVKFTNSRFYGNPGNPTPGGSAFLWARDNAPFFIVEDSTLAPNQPPLPTGGTTMGTDKGIFSYVPFQLRRSNIYGTNIPVGFEIERNETTGVLIEDNYLHDIWSSAGDHTDIVNGNSHASHVVVRHNYLDGIRVGNSYVTNGIGIYDDPVSSGSGIIEDWVIDRNYFDRAATMILSTSDSARFLNPFVLTNNTFTNRFSAGRVFTRKPSAQSGNVDQDGKALEF